MVNSIKAYGFVIILVIGLMLLLLLPDLSHAATNGDWEGVTDQDLAISFTVSDDQATNISTRIRVFCSGFSVVVMTNHGSRDIINNSFTINSSTSACNPYEPWITKPYGFTGTFTDDNTCTGTYFYSTNQFGTWGATSSCSTPQIESFSTSSQNIKPGENATLSWSISNADSANIDQEVGPVNAAAGSINVTPSETTTYTLSATNACGTVQDSVTVTISERIAWSLRFALNEDFYGNLSGWKYSIDVAGLVTGYERYVLKNPNGNIVIDSLSDISGTTFAFGDIGDGEHIGIIQYGYNNTDYFEAGFYTLGLWDDGQLTEYILPYEVTAEDIPTSTPVIISPTQNSILAKQTVTISWEECPIPFVYDDMSNYVDLLGAYEESMHVGNATEATFTLPTGTYNCSVHATFFKYVTEEVPYFAGFHFIQECGRMVNFEVRAAPVITPAILLLLGTE